MKQKKFYINPKIKAVTLDPKQSILQVCKVIAGAIYFSGGNKCLVEGGPGAVTLTCPTDVKGDNSVVGSFVASSDPNNIPS